jgi:hypothetical protein
MDQLRELARLVSRKKLKKISILGKSKNYKIDQLYDLLTDDKITSETVLHRTLDRGSGAQGVEDMKKELKETLVDMLFLIDVNQPINSDPHLAYEAAWRMWSAANLLLLKNEITSGIEYAEKALRLADQFEFIDLSLQIVKQLRKIYATYLGNEQQFNHYNQRYQDYKDAVMTLAIAKEEYLKVILASEQPPNELTTLAEITKTSYLRLAPLAQQHPYYEIHLYKFHLEATYYYLAGKYSEGIATCQLAVDFLQEKPFDLKSSIIGFKYQQLLCFAKQHDYEQVINKLREGYDLLGERDDLTFAKFSELGFLLFIHGKRYDEAQWCYQQMQNRIAAKNIDSNTEFIWKTYGAYLYFLSFPHSPENAEKINSRPKKFASTPISIHKNERYLAVPRLLIQLLLALQGQNYKLAVTIIAALNQYTARYLKNDGYYRSNCLLNMIKQLPEAGFHRSAVERYTIKFQEKLSAYPCELLYQEQENEVIPYERLWKMLLALLPTKRRVKTPPPEKAGARKKLSSTNADSFSASTLQLQELTSIVSRKKLMKLSVPGQQKDSKLDELYLFFSSSKTISESEIAFSLYGKDERFPAYLKLKSKLKGRLIDLLFLVDKNQAIGDDTSIAYEEAWRQWSSVNLMYLKGAFTTCTEYAEQVLALTMRFEHIDLSLEAVKMLRTIAALHQKDEKQFLYYNQLFEKYQEVSLAEAKVEEYYEKMMILAINKISNSKEIALLGEQLFKELAPMLEKYSEFSIHRFIRSIQLTYLLNSQAYQETIDASQQAIDFLSGKQINFRNTLTGLLSHQLVCYTQLKDYENGRKKLTDCLEAIGEDHSRTYFKVTELGVILSLHSKHYQEAYELAYDTINNNNLKKQIKAVRENWKITQTYIHYLIVLGQVKPMANDEVFTNFRLGKFLNEVPVFSKDKRGMNIPILIIQLLLNIALKRYDQVFDRIDAIEKYTSRYIRHDDHYRSNCFIKMLLQIPISGFDRKMAEKNARRYRLKLSQEPLEIANQPHEVEIIPYEDIWDLALASLH